MLIRDDSVFDIRHRRFIFVIIFSILFSLFIDFTVFYIPSFLFPYVSFSSYFAFMTRTKLLPQSGALEHN